MRETSVELRALVLVRTGTYYLGRAGGTHRHTRHDGIKNAAIIKQFLKRRSALRCSISEPSSAAPNMVLYRALGNRDKDECGS